MRGSQVKKDIFLIAKRGIYTESLGKHVLATKD
jgi:hypothetical protein